MANYKPKQYYKQAAPPALPIELDHKIVFRDSKGKAGQMNVNINDAAEPEDAVLLVKDALVKSGEGWNVVLAVLEGGKQK